MKSLYILAGVALFGAVTFTSCSEQDFPTPSANKIPVAADYAEKVNIVVDPETNQVTFNLDAPGVMPVWIFDGTTYSTVNGLAKIYATAGDYEVEMKVLNSNGISDGSLFATFHVENTIVNYDKYYTLLAGDGTREWRVDNKAAAHLACGEAYTDGTNWWAAKEDEKASSGMYDNRLKFTKDNEYTFMPGESGTMYVNVNVTRFGVGGQDQDYNVPAEEQTTKYSFEVIGNDLFIVFQKGANFPYIANDYIYDNPRYLIQSITANKLELVSTYPGQNADHSDGISWHYIFTSKEPAGETPDVPSGTQWVDVNSADNLMKADGLALASFWWADDNWSQVADPECVIDGRKATITTMQQSGGSQWQGQAHFNTGVVIEEGVTYDFRVIINPEADLKGVTVKPHPEGDDGHMFSEARHDLAAYSDNAIEYTNFTADFSTANLVITFDFPGCPAGTVIEIKDIIVQTHRGGGSASAEGANLMDSGALSLASFWWADDNWSQVADPTITIDGNNAVIVSTAASGNNQWQGQTHLNTGVAIEEGKTYNFYITLIPEADLKGATVKPHPEGDDGHMFSEARHDLAAYEENVVKYANYTADFSTANLVITLDFPGCPAGTAIEVKDIKICETTPVTPETPTVGGTDLMADATLSLASFWWADDNWSQVADPTVTFNGNSAVIVATAPSGHSRWQGQAHFNTGVAIEEGVTYDFVMTIIPDVDFDGATVKPHPEGDDGHMFSEATHKLAAYEENEVVYAGYVADFSTDNLVITTDFPGCPAGASIELTGIKIYKH